MGTTTDNDNGDEGVIKGGSIPGHDPFGDPSDSKATGEDPAETKSDDQSATEDDQPAEEDTTPPASESESAGQPTGSEVAIPEIIIPDTSEELMGRTGGTTGGTKSTKRQIENGEKPRGPNGGGGDEPPSTEDPDSQPQTPDEEDDSAGSKDSSKEDTKSSDSDSRRSSIIKGAVALGLLLIAMLVIVDQCMSDSDSGSTVGDQGASPVVVDDEPEIDCSVLATVLVNDPEVKRLQNGVAPRLGASLLRLEVKEVGDGFPENGIEMIRLIFGSENSQERLLFVRSGYGGTYYTGLDHGKLRQKQLGDTSRETANGSDSHLHLKESLRDPKRQQTS